MIFVINRGNTIKIKKMIEYKNKIVLPIQVDIDYF